MNEWKVGGTLHGGLHIEPDVLLALPLRLEVALADEEAADGVEEGHVHADVALLHQELEILELGHLGALAHQLDDADLDEGVWDGFCGQAARGRHRRKHHGEHAILQLIVNLVKMKQQGQHQWK